jgi:pimeloyl-ACP methyl ester carboxylesterase/predicted glycosyltransferase
MSIGTRECRSGASRACAGPARALEWSAREVIAMRARFPDLDGVVDSGGVKIAYEVFGDGPRTVVLTAPDPIVHSAAWKAQVPFLARHARVVTIDPRGNGKSERPRDSAAYADELLAADTLSVMDHLGVDKAVLAAICSSTWPATLVAAAHPDRVQGLVSIATWLPYVTPPLPWRADYPWGEPLDTTDGWAKDNRYYWEQDWPGYVRFFFGELIPEPHSTKQWEDCVEWALQGGPEVQIASKQASLSVSDREGTLAVLQSIDCPVLAVHGELDRCQPLDRSRLLAERSGGRFVRLEGAGHLPQARHPVVVNHLIKEFLDEVAPPLAPNRTVTTWRTAATRPPRALFLSSPIGLGHGRRDLAIARALRELRPDCEIDWLAQHPVTELLVRGDEHVHPASAGLASETAHIESECGEHDLHAFQAIRRMDEILLANYHVFEEVVEQEGYNLVVADEAWDVDHFWHENPELKRGTLAWLTDFVGWVPFPDGGATESSLTRDYNAEMIEHVARYPNVRDRSIFVGDPVDVMPGALGEGLPGMREWTEQHFEFCGYITGFEPVPPADHAGVRAELGYRPGERVCIVTVGGSGVGLDLIRACVRSFDEASRLVPGLRMIVVTGPRIDPARVTGGEALPDGLEVRAYVHDLWRHLAVCDLAVVQGGLTTTMELTASRRPFVYVPLRHHFEQQYHVRHRLDRYRAGHAMTYDDAADPGVMARTIAGEIGRDVDYEPVPGGAAQRAAARLVDLL